MKSCKKERGYAVLLNALLRSLLFFRVRALYRACHYCMEFSWQNARRINRTFRRERKTSSAFPKSGVYILSISLSHAGLAAASLSAHVETRSRENNRALHHSTQRHPTNRPNAITGTNHHTSPT